MGLHIFLVLAMVNMLVREMDERIDELLGGASGFRIWGLGFRV